MHSSISRSEVWDLSSSRDSRSPDATIEARFHGQLQRLFGDSVEKGIPTNATGRGDKAGNTANDLCDDEAYDFRLYAGPATVGPNQSHVTQRIALRSPSPADTAPGFREPRRPDSFYFTGIPDVQQKAQFEMSALSSEQVLKGLKTIWKGLEMPWRVTHVKVEGVKQRGLGALQQESTGTRKRNGKKRRIIIRKKMQAQILKETASRQRLIDKELADKEKRTLRNREKKVKKKAKEKSQKSQATAEVG